ncbi:hypothetical protein ECNE037_2242 [Escherichia coli NE037]|nr:hypothetical protein [Escherichia coli]EIO29312.1 hypothetical protein ECPA40_2269 [Escherichia coli PA40]EKH45534.1 hypothetical protein ECNE1487_2494 [Escherichia coli NE1487]EKH53509.1 hypothetical protein ECNE037_2242 [Escherichia coli NE037]
MTTRIWLLPTLSWRMCGQGRLTTFARRLSGTQKLQDWVMATL